MRYGDIDNDVTQEEQPLSALATMEALLAHQYNQAPQTTPRRRMISKEAMRIDAYRTQLFANLERTAMNMEFSWPDLTQALQEEDAQSLSLAI